MTTKLTDHQLKMCALAGGYKGFKWIPEVPATPGEGTMAGDPGYPAHASILYPDGYRKEWCPIKFAEDSQNLMSDARIDVEWSLNKEGVKANAFLTTPGNNPNINRCVTTDWMAVEGYPSAPEAMRWAIVLCAVAKGEAM